MFRSLITSRRFAPLFWCQFFAAFNDNFLKSALAFLLLFKLGSAGSASLVTLGGAVFIAPSFLLSGLAGELADRFDKAIIAERLKRTEIGAAAVAAVRLLPQFGSRPLPCPLPLRRARRPFRAGQIRPPARQSSPRRAARGQCSDRGRHLSRDPLRHHRRRPCHRRERQRRRLRRGDHGLRRALLAREPPHPEERRQGARPRRRAQHFPLDGGACSGMSGATTGSGAAA